MRHVTLNGLVVGAMVLVAAPAARAGCLETAFARFARHIMATPAAADTLRFHRVTPESSVVIPPLPSGAPAPPATPTPRAVGFHPGDITKIGSDIHIAEDEVVEGDVVALGGSITVDGHVKGAVVSVGGDVSLSSTARVDGDVGSVGGELHEETGDFVGGQRFTAAGHRGGRLRSHIPIAALTFTERLVSFISNIFKQLILIGLAWLVARFAAGRTAAAVETLRREPGASAGIGALVWALLIPSVIALALVMAILCITLIGIPLALAALVGYVAFFIVFPVWGLVVGAAAFGYRVAAQRGQPVPTLERAAVLGMAVVAAVSVAGSLLRLIGFLPPVHGLGTFLHLVATAFSVVLATLGGGAWLRSEFATGAFGRWWAGRRSMPGWPGRTAPAPQAAGVAPDWSATAPPPGAQTPYVPPVPPPYQAPAVPPYQAPVAPPPSPPEAFAPPPPPAPSAPGAWMPSVPPPAPPPAAGPPPAPEPPSAPPPAEPPSTG